MITSSDFSSRPRPRPRSAASQDPPSKARRPPPDPAATPAAEAGLRDPVTAVHDSIDFARAIVADGGHHTAGLTMLRGEVQQLAREVAAFRREVAATRQDADRVRADLLTLGQFTRGLLVDRLASRFRDIDRRLSAAEAAAGRHVGPDFDCER